MCVKVKGGCHSSTAMDTQIFLHSIVVVVLVLILYIGGPPQTKKQRRGATVKISSRAVDESGTYGGKVSSTRYRSKRTSFRLERVRTDPYTRSRPKSGQVHLIETLLLNYTAPDRAHPDTLHCPLMYLIKPTRARESSSKIARKMLTTDTNMKFPRSCLGLLSRIRFSIPAARRIHRNMLTRALVTEDGNKSMRQLGRSCHQLNYTTKAQ